MLFDGKYGGNGIEFGGVVIERGLVFNFYRIEDVGCSFRLVCEKLWFLYSKGVLVMVEIV